MSRGGPKGTSDPVGYGSYLCTSVWGARMMSCSVRKKGPKWVSKYSFSRCAWLLGADQRSTGLVVTRMYTRPEEHVAMKAREKKMTQPGFRTQKEPHCAKSCLRQTSNAAPSGSQQDASPGREGRERGWRLGAEPFLKVATGKALDYCTWQESHLHWGCARDPPALSYALACPP